MLQLNTLSHAAHGALRAESQFPPAWENMAQLEKAADNWMRRLMGKRREIARKQGLLTRLHETIDAKIRTEEMEYLDVPDYPPSKKLEMVRALHAFNILMFSYHRYVYLLTPLIREVANAKKRPARLLELAGGSGELALSLARLAHKKELPVEITGSDYIPQYIDAGNRIARERSLPIRFIKVNAFDMHDLEPGAFDLIMISQSTHHFSPGQLAMMIAQSARIASTAFISFDGERSFMLFPAVVGPPLLTLRKHFIHDAFLTSRKVYSEFELECIARIAAPRARSTVKRSIPGVTVLTVRFD